MFGGRTVFGIMQQHWTRRRKKNCKYWISFKGVSYINSNIDSFDFSSYSNHRVLVVLVFNDLKARAYEAEVLFSSCTPQQIILTVERTFSYGDDVY